ncbi:MAG: tryptophan synthase subunit alpha [Thermoleophilia bacterium]
MVQVKICGLTRRDDALRAVECGADALGFVFVPSSRRRADAATVARVVSDLPPTVTTLGVFQDQPVADVRDIMLSCGLDVAQLHGAEDTHYMETLALPVLKAIGLSGRGDLRSASRYRGLGVILLDAAHVECSADGDRRIVTGGTGVPFDWALADSAHRFGRIVLSGGLHPDNVAQAIAAVRPWALDVASGVEREPGRKDPDKLRLFLRRAKKAAVELGDENPRPAVEPTLVGKVASGWGRVVETTATGRLRRADFRVVGRLEGALRARRAEGGKSLVPFLMGGYPDSETFRALLLEAQRVGADAVEIGIASHDPVLDGPLIRRVSREILERGTAPLDVLTDVVRARSEGLTIPIVLMTYKDLLMGARGSSFAAEAAGSGIQGLLVVDPMRPDAARFPRGLQGSELEKVLLVGPTTPANRYRWVLERTRGFVYCVSAGGGTGGGEASVPTAREIVRRVRRHGDVPALVCFGISGPEAAREIAAVADGIIVGSALLASMHGTRGPAAVAAVGRFLQELRQAVDHP